jgi:hypothetical protein
MYALRGVLSVPLRDCPSFSRWNGAAAVPEMQKAVRRKDAAEGGHTGVASARVHSAFLNASRAATCTARHGVCSHADAVSLVSECSIPDVERRPPAALGLIRRTPPMFVLVTEKASKVFAR